MEIKWVQNRLSRLENEMSGELVGCGKCSKDTQIMLIPIYSISEAPSGDADFSI